MFEILIIGERNFMTVAKTVLQTKCWDWNIKTVAEGREAIKIAHEFLPDIVLVDWELPDMYGDAVCKYFRSSDYTGDPCICMLIDSQVSVEDKVKYYKIGIDHYINKPVSFKELPFQLTSMLRGSNKMMLVKQKVQSLVTKCLVMQNDGEVYFHTPDIQCRLELTSDQFKLLKMLVQNQGHLCLRQNLAYELWGNSFGQSRAIDAHIRRLRLKLNPYGKKIILCQRGMGYLYDDSSIKY